MENCKILQVYYKHNQLNTLYDSKIIVPTYNPAPSKFKLENEYYTLENRIIRDELPKLDAHYVGVWSHKHFIKIDPASQDRTFHKGKHNKQHFIKWFEQRCNRKDFDVFGFHKRYNNMHRVHMLKRANDWHPNFKNALERLIEKSGVKLNMKTPYNFVTLMNYQVARKDVYMDYIDSVLAPIMEAMLDDSDKQLQEWLFTDSRYKGDAKNEGTLMRIGNRPYYTLHTFILERLFTLFINSRKLKCVNY